MNSNRDILRGKIENYIRFLNEEKGFQLKDIISEILIYSSECVYGEVVSVDNDIEITCDEVEDISIDHHPNTYTDVYADAETDEERDKIYDVEMAKLVIKKIKRHLNDSRRSIESGHAGKGHANSINGRIEWLTDKISEQAQEELKEEMKKIKNEASELAKRAEIAWAESKINESNLKLIHNVRTISTIISDLDEAESTLLKNSAIAKHHIKLINETKTRCASHRAKKKALEAEVAEKSGNEKKSSKLKDEASALLEQDWRLIMKNDNTPNIAQLVK